MPLYSDSEDSAIGNLLIFVNPNSGSGKGVQIFNSKVAVELKRNKISYELVITTSLNHAKSIVRERDDLTKFNGILILSGDGLIYEVLNGLRGRCDSNIILPSLPIGIVPSGSGNGLLSSLFANKGEPLKNPKFMKRAVEISCSPAAQAQPINLIDVQTDKENITAFLSIGWGIMADIDIESERWRRMNCIKAQCQGEDINTSSYTSYGFREDARYVQTIPDIQNEVSKDWITIEDEFIGVYAVALSHISNTGPFMSQARLDDDRIYLTYILKKDVPSRLDIIKFLNSIGSQKHQDMPFLKVI
uniref:DAGKc domain-containing protein n=1 Tax=Heterorhabditis bacteriophora TaxID=37862 RepID=A0A1I7WRJ4_HETBA